MEGLNTLSGWWAKLRRDDEELYPEVTGVPDLPPAVKDVVYWVICLAGESAEMLNLVKKRWRNGHWDPDDLAITEELLEEAVDIHIYLIELFEELGVDEERLNEKFQAKRFELHQRWTSGDLCVCPDCCHFAVDHPDLARELVVKAKGRKEARR